MAQVLVRSPQVKAEISRCAQLVQRCAGDANYVVYAILDPTQEDPFGTYAGLPIYVGETRNVGSRIMEHFRTACGEMAKDTGRKPYIRQMLESGVVAPFVILQKIESRIDSLVPSVSGKRVPADQSLHGPAHGNDTRENRENHPIRAVGNVNQRRDRRWVEDRSKLPLVRSGKHFSAVRIPCLFWPLPDIAENSRHGCKLS